MDFVPDLGAQLLMLLHGDVRMNLGMGFVPDSASAIIDVNKCRGACARIGKWVLFQICGVLSLLRMELLHVDVRMNFKMIFVIVK